MENFQKLEINPENSFDKYKTLKEKELLGQLTQEEFEKLLDFDFEEKLQNNTPINGIFSSEEELQKIKSLPKEQKREALAIFKENLARQREALATLRVFIERNIEFNHDVSKEKLLALTEKFSAKYGFTSKQKQVIEKLINKYFENHQKVLEIRQQFPDNYELISELTGVKIDEEEKIDILVGPMTIDIYTEGFNAGRLYERADKPVIFKYAGFASQSVIKNDIYYTVINTDKKLRKNSDDPTGEITKKHEHEHQKNRLFGEVFGYIKSPIELKGYIAEKDIEIKTTILENFFIENRIVALERVRDEIIAYTKTRDLSIFNEKGPYDYLGPIRKLKKFENDPLYQKTAQKVLVSEYEIIIEDAFDSYVKLVTVGKYSTQEAIALLTDKTLFEWPKTVKRLLEQRNK